MDIINMLNEKKINIKRDFLCLLLFLVFIPKNAYLAEKNVKVMRVFIDPGHTRYTNRAKDLVGEEHELNYKVSKYLAELLKNDKRFYFELSRDENVYLGKIKEVVKKNESFLRGIVSMKLSIDKRSVWLLPYDRMEIYAVRRYAIFNRFDCFISVHFDYTWYKRKHKSTEGFHIMVSPYNRQRTKSVKLAYSVRNSMAKTQPVNLGIRHNNNKIVPKSFREKYDMQKLLEDGISIRSVMILGDAFEYFYHKRENIPFNHTDIPSVLVESGFLHEKKFLKESELKEIAYRIYLGLVDYYKKTYNPKEVARK